MGVRTAERMTGISMVNLLRSDEPYYTAMRGRPRSRGSISGNPTSKRPLAWRLKSHSAEMMVVSDTIRWEATDESLVITCPGPSAFFNSLFWADNPGRLSNTAGAAIGSTPTAAGSTDNDHRGE